MQEWTVAGGLVEGPDGSLLLVRNRRRWGTHDWSPPGGVIDATDAGVVEGLTREVFEETGISVSEWDGPVYEVSAKAFDFGWHLRAQIFVARRYDGEIAVDDPDGIVVDAAFVAGTSCGELLADCFPWVREPLGEWIEHRWGADAPRAYHYEVYGTDPTSLRVERVEA
ncbi:MAG TPA: NUDIX hydrolase [Acidimicrobiia bacterium]|nr:NUDIX hydrolase [Acidimicrobiia bacterium]